MGSIRYDLNENDKKENFFIDAVILSAYNYEKDVIDDVLKNKHTLNNKVITPLIDKIKNNYKDYILKDDTKFTLQTLIPDHDYILQHFLPDSFVLR